VSGERTQQRPTKRPQKLMMPVCTLNLAQVTRTQQTVLGTPKPACQTTQEDTKVDRKEKAANLPDTRRSKNQGL